MHRAIRNMSANTKLDPRTFPRPPKLERVNRHLQVKWTDGTMIADTKDAYWVLETYHPPTYYFPQSAIKLPLQRSDARQTFCEWKGRATYWDLTVPAGASGSQADTTIKSKIWSYESPTPGFKDIKDYLCFYASPWECFVDEEKVIPQPGDFYGGWTTSEILTEWVKGAPGTRGW